MKITKFDDDKIEFSDGSAITYEHEQDCCECNWADFSVLEVFYDKDFEFNRYDVTPVDGAGFLLSLYYEGSSLCYEEWRKNIFIPCYSDQNGYYATDLDIVITSGDEVKRVMLDCNERVD